MTLLPTPAVNDMGRGKTPQDWDDWTQAMRDKHGNGNGHGKSLEIEAQRLLPTPRATDGTKGGPNQRGSSGDLMLPSAVQPQRLLPLATARDWKDGATDPDDVPVNGLLGRAVVSPETALAGGPRQADEGRGEGACDGCRAWGPYAPAIHRWEVRLGRLAPSPTVEGKDGRPRLSARAVEFMMGLPDGWVTGTGIPRNAQLKALGNGCVPQQVALALSMLLPRLDQP